MHVVPCYVVKTRIIYIYMYFLKECALNSILSDLIFVTFFIMQYFSSSLLSLSFVLFFVSYTQKLVSHPFDLLDISAHQSIHNTLRLPMVAIQSLRVLTSSIT